MTWPAWACPPVIAVPPWTNNHCFAAFAASNAALSEDADRLKHVPVYGYGFVDRKGCWINVVPIRETINAFPSWQLSDGISCDVTVTSGPFFFSLESFFFPPGKISLAQPKRWVRIPFDMHSFHNLLASLLKGHMSAGLTFDLCFGFFFNLTSSDWNENWLSFQIMLVWHTFMPAFNSKAQAFKWKEICSYIPWKKKKIPEKFQEKLWSLVIWWRPGLARCLGCKDWKSTNEGLLLVQD